MDNTEEKTPYEGEIPYRVAYGMQVIGYLLAAAILVGTIVFILL